MTDTPQTDLYTRQVALEQEMAQLGQAQVAASILSADTNGGSMRKKSSQTLADLCAPLMRDAYADYRALCEAKRGPKPAAHRLLEPVRVDFIIAATITTVLDTLTNSAKLSATAIALGKVLDTEVRLGAIQGEARKIMGYKLRDMTERKLPDHAKRKAILKYKRNKLDLEDKQWTLAETQQVGVVLINMLLESTGIATIELVAGPAKPGKASVKSAYYAIVPSPDLLKQLTERDEASVLLGVTYLPMLVPPRAHDATSLYSGGYLTDSSIPLVSPRTIELEHELNGIAPELANVRRAVNAVQRTPWKVNAFVLDVANALWARGGAVAGLPASVDVEMPPEPPGLVAGSEELKAYKVARFQIHEFNALIVTKRIATLRTLALANRFAPEASIWFPAKLDFRGRLYLVSSGYLSPQGRDIEKGCLLFGNGEPVDANSFDYVLLQAANTFGVDKLAFADRIAFVRENMAQILASVTNPLDSGAFWLSADKPFQFLAACEEIARYTEALAAGTESDFRSYLPCSADATASGHQLYAAAGRDEKAGLSTNLIPGTKPGDLYMDVVNATIASLRAVVQAGAQAGAQAGVQAGVQAGEEDSLLAQQIIDMELDRKMAKTSVMVSVYSGTKRGASNNIHKWYAERLETSEVGSAATPWDKNDSYKPLALLVEHLWDAIKSSTEKASEFMSFTREITGVLAKAGLPLQWTTLDGLPVSMAYPKTDSKRIKTQLGTRLMELRVNKVVPGEIDIRRQKNGSAPNLIHSQDACMLRMYVNLLENEPTETHVSHAVVHDDYATHARYAALSGRCLRQAFVNLHIDSCIFKQIRDNAIAALGSDKGIPELPKKGSLNIESVLESRYFFS